MRSLGYHFNDRLTPRDVWQSPQGAEDFSYPCALASLFGISVAKRRDPEATQRLALRIDGTSAPIIWVPLCSPTELTEQILEYATTYSQYLHPGTKA